MRLIIKYFIPLLCVAVVISAVAGVFVMLLWNAVVPSLFGLACVSFWQAFGLFVLCHLLFGSLSLLIMVFGGFIHAFFHHRNNSPRHLHEWWSGMTEEERKDFINCRRRAFFGHGFDRNAGEDTRHNGERQ